MDHRESSTYYLDIQHINPVSPGTKLPVISLFSGAGGLDIGLEQAGFTTVACVENDIHCRETLRYNRPEWTLIEEAQHPKGKPREAGDIRKIEVGEILEKSGLKSGEAALVVGGAPCQPFSNMGKKKGREDKENGDLFLEFVRVVKGVKPKGFIFENVAGITQSKHQQVLDYMIASFSGSGYSLTHTILNAADYGVPQRRERFFLLGLQGDTKPLLPLPTHFKGWEEWKKFIADFDHKPSYSPKPWRTVRETFNDLPKDYKKRSDYALMNTSEKVRERMKLIPEGKNFKVLPMDMRPNCWKNGKHQGNDTFGRMIADYPSVTIRTAAYNPAKGMYIHPFENRGLNIIEMAALQGFPPDWHFKCFGRKVITLVSGGKQIGNAVPPPLARAIGFSIREQLLNNLTEKNSSPYIFSLSE